jgi:hypothetical protein
VPVLSILVKSIEKGFLRFASPSCKTELEFKITSLLPFMYDEKTVVRPDFPIVM